MTNDNLLSQEEIDLLTGGQANGDTASDAQTAASPEKENPEEKNMGNGDILDSEKDALGEVGNISMGSASTTLSELLGQKVNITSPQVTVTNKGDLKASFKVPYLVIRVEFVEGLSGFNVLVMKVRDAKVIADLMMGGDGQLVDEAAELNEMDISAAAEAMNMMIGSASTSLAQMFGMPVNISPPQSTVLQRPTEGDHDDLLSEVPDDENLVVVSFNMTIGDLVDTDIMQVLSVGTAKEQASLLLQGLEDMLAGDISAPEDVDLPELETSLPESEPSDDMMDQSEIENLVSAMATEPPLAAPAPQSQPAQAAPVLPLPHNLDLILDIPLTVSVILGRTKKPIKDVLNIGPGAVVELQALADEPVEVLVNDTLVAEGEVVVVNENFGVKLTHIISPEERVKRLAK